MDIDKIKKSMTNIKPNSEKIKRIELLRTDYKGIVDVLGTYCNDSRETALAVTNLENSLMWAVKGIVLEEEK